MNLVFDFGNVIIEWDKEIFLKTLLPDDESRCRVDDSIFGSGLWEEMDAGLHTIEEVELKVNEALSYEFEEEVHQIMWYWYRYARFYDDVVKKMASLKQHGHKLYILSNTSQLFYPCLEERAPELLSILDGKILSYEVKQSKPAPQIYQTLLKTFDLEPSNTYFFDDLEKNLEAARNQGINTYQVTEIRLFLEYLDVFLK
ncbi:HAD family hydrolase [Streptococcus suis]|uniref:HAD family hydrolase n=1 Tax=Streptococcus suis TaxID=1307 RepID=UPI00022F8B16|nr:HAD family phosphatase [Streptococcus suis]AER17312.1 hypothetical protein SSUD9_1111 [Streptococcus suis D9]